MHSGHRLLDFEVVSPVRLSSFTSEGQSCWGSSMFAKCASAACSAAFDFHIGGSFFRFTKGDAKPSLDDANITGLGNVHDVEHYWLCPRCARIYTLVHIAGAGVVLKPLWMEQPIAEIPKTIVAA
jgi:hypothetical protein